MEVCRSKLSASSTNRPVRSGARNPTSASGLSVGTTNTICMVLNPSRPVVLLFALRPYRLFLLFPTPCAVEHYPPSFQILAALRFGQTKQKRPCWLHVHTALHPSLAPVSTRNSSSTLMSLLITALVASALATLRRANRVARRHDYYYHYYFTPSLLHWFH